MELIVMKEEEDEDWRFLELLLVYFFSMYKKF